MKTRDVKELHTKNGADLRILLAETRDSLRAARLEFAQQKLSNTTSLAILRRDIARIQTVLQMKTADVVTTPKGEGANAKEKSVARSIVTKATGDTKPKTDKGGKKA